MAENKDLSYFIQLGSKWKIGNGKEINLWHDLWWEDGSISARFPLYHFPLDQRLSTILHDGSWSISSHLPFEIKAILLQASLLLSSRPGSNDVLCWNLIRSLANSISWGPLILEVNLHSKNCMFWMAFDARPSLGGRWI